MFERTYSDTDEVEVGFFYIVAMTNEFGGVVTVDGQSWQLITKKWERVTALMERWEPMMQKGWKIVVENVTATNSFEFTKQ